MKIVVRIFLFFFMFSVFHDSGLLSGEEQLLSLPKKSAVSLDLNFTKIRLHFVANKGQVDKRVHYYAMTSGYNLWLTRQGLVFDYLFRRNSVQSPNGNPLKGRTLKNENEPLSFQREVSRLIFIGANKKVRIRAIEPSSARVNYFIGNRQSGWRSDLPTSFAVLYRNLFEKINLKIYGVEKQIEYDWIVQPGGNPRDILFSYRGAKRTLIDKVGNLVIENGYARLVHKKPVGWQVLDGKKVKVEVDFRKTGKNTYGFKVAEYDKSAELVIDPVVLLYSTYIGGSIGQDFGKGIAVDDNGFAYVVGHTNGSDYPLRNEYQTTYLGWSDMVVTKLNTNSSGDASLVYSTYLGGTHQDYGYDIAVDSGGNAYICGETDSTDFPILKQYMTHPGNGTRNVVVARLNAAGNAILYSTYLGGDADDMARGIALDSSGYVYIVGWTGSTDFPVLNQYQSHQSLRDIIVAKLDTNQSGAASLLYSTYLGGSDYESGFSIAADNSGNAYITGYSYSVDFPLVNPYQSFQGESDAIVAKIDTTQSGAGSLVHSTYLGGTTDEDEGMGIALGGSGDVFVIGSTYSTDFPTVNPYMGDPGDDNCDIFVARLHIPASGASSLVYSTYLGGMEGEWARDIVVDSSGTVHATGMTRSMDFPVRDQYMTDPGDYDADAFVTGLNTTQSGAASLLYSTYLGGNDSDYSESIAVDSSGHVYITGYTQSSDYPLVNEYQTFADRDDVLVTKLFHQSLFPPTVTTTAVSGITSTSAAVGGNVTDDGGASVSERGICWGTNSRPTRANSQVETGGSGLGTFTCQLTGLTPNTTYYVRAFARNSAGTGYGEILSCKTLEAKLTISGRVTLNGNGLFGVSMNFSGIGNNILTDSGGYYSQTVDKGWSGTVTPAKLGHVFSPVSRGYQNLESNQPGQNYLAYILTISLQAARKTERAWILSREYGDITVGINNPGKMEVAEYVLLRKENNGGYKTLKEIPGSELQNNSYQYYDTGIEKGKNYTYRLEARNDKGEVLALSNEVTI